jgi:hypothetical protein
MDMLFLPGEITERFNCCDRIEPLTKHPANPVLVADKAWESSVAYPCVIRDPNSGIFRMWYEADIIVADKLNPKAPMVDGVAMQYEMYLCYAESTDGITWTKPALNLMKVDQYGDNNIVHVDSGFIGGIGTVIDNEDEPDPERRFKLLIYDNDGKGHDGARTAISPDGIHWSFIGEFPVLASQDTPSLWHDRQRNRYVAFLKTRLANKRARMISISEDFITWSEPNILLAPDLADAPTLEFYAQNAFHHCGKDLGLLCRFDLATQRTDLELINAPDGTAWRRLPTRPVVLGPGDMGSWDSGGIYPGTGDPIDVDGVCRLYYGGTNSRHDAYTGGSAGIGIASFAQGRLAGQQFVGEGWFQTIPFKCPGGKLTIDTKSHEPITVEIHSTGYGGPVAGFMREECRAVNGDNSKHVVTWNGADSLASLRGQFIQLRIYGSDGLAFGASIQ